MIEGATLEQVAEPVLRLVGLPEATVETTLLGRGLDPTGLEEVKEAIASVGLPFTLEDAIAYTFRASEDDLPFRVGRFGNGQYPVFYSALEENTCVSEMRYHVGALFERQGADAGRYPRYYEMIQCQLDGQAMMLVGHEASHPDLISVTDTGYPFCQKVAQWSIQQGADALHTRSARQPEGTCTPVFVHSCLANPEAVGRFRFSLNEAGDVEAERLDAAEG